VYNIMLVDDDPIALVKLKAMINWDELGCKLIAEAKSGKSAIELLKECKPDIVFTDISMPHVSGVELINHINETEGNMKVVALSAYDDFDYVRGSLKSGAKDYLLKHRITEDGINELIRSLIREIDAEQSRKHAAAIADNRTDLLARIVEGHADVERLDERLEREKLSWLKDELLLVIGGVDAHFSEGQSGRTDEQTVRIMIDEAIKYFRNYFLMPLEPGLFLLTFSAKEITGEEIEDVVKQIQATLFRFCGVPLSFSVSERFRGMENIKMRKEIHKTILLEHYFKGNKQFIVRHEGLGQPDVILNEAQFMQLGDILYLEEQHIRDFFDGMFADLAEKYLTKEWIRLLYLEIIMFLKRTIKSKQLDEHKIFRNGQPGDVWLSFYTYEDMKAYLVDVFTEAQKELKKSFAKHSLTERAMRYVEEHFRDKLTLRDVADALFVSPPYLSRTFKKSTGINLITYVNRVKMKHARELILQRKMSLQDIAYEVGIINYNYFYILFKETYGITPSDFLKRIDQEEQEKKTK
jgi:two-component system response regulator YesN